MTVVMTNCRKKDVDSTDVKIKEINVVNNVTRVVNKPKLSQAIGDTGTTGNFVLPGAPVDDVQKATNPIEIEMANGTEAFPKARIHATYGSLDCQKN